MRACKGRKTKSIPRRPRSSLQAPRTLTYKFFGTRRLSYVFAFSESNCLIELSSACLITREPCKVHTWTPFPIGIPQHEFLDDKTLSFCAGYHQVTESFVVYLSEWHNLLTQNYALNFIIVVFVEFLHLRQ